MCALSRTHTCTEFSAGIEWKGEREKVGSSSSSPRDANYDTITALMQRELKEEEEEVLLLLIKFLHSFFSDSLAVGAAAAIELHHQLLLLHRKCVCLLSAELNLSVQHISTFSYLTIERRCCFASDCF